MDNTQVDLKTAVIGQTAERICGRIDTGKGSNNIAILKAILDDDQLYYAHLMAVRIDTFSKPGNAVYLKFTFEDNSVIRHRLTSV